MKKPLKYQVDEGNQFVADFKCTDWEDSLHHYEGRWFWKGPSITCETYELQEVMQQTKVPLQWESLGLRFIVFPRKNCGDLKD